MEQQQTQASQAKYSRYRAVRAVPPSKSDHVPPEQDMQHIQNASLSRTKSMSRYRRPKLALKYEGSSGVPSLSESQGPSRSPIPIPRSPIMRRTTDPVGCAAGLPLNYAQTRRPIPQRSQTHLGATGEPQDHNGQQQGYESNYYSDNGVCQNRVLSPANSPPAVSVPIQLSDEETERILAEQKRKDLERLEATLDAAANELAKSPPPKFAFFSSKRRATTTTKPISPGPLDNFASIQRAIADGPPRNDAPVISLMGIQQGGGGVVPQTDAPISASNAPERRVLIRSKQSSINLPVDGDTTPIDIITSAANVMPTDIDPRTAVLIESYAALGLERKIRRYEHIRDIMNSWDRDTQNALIVEGSDYADEHLESSSVPRDAPPDVTVQLYHSQKPGKWNKRYITLLSSGQVFVSKKSGMGLNDKDSMNICHLSDFDIYTPTAQQVRKILKPPRKNCYAIKSQQKTAIFLSTENFVHFFCTDDKIEANAWYSAVQSWRSWYLVNKRGEGQEVATKTVKTIKTKILSEPGTGAETHRVNISVDEDPYTFGTLKPLVDMERFDKSEADDSTTEDENPRQVPFHLRNNSNIAPRPRTAKGGPPISYRAPPQEDQFASNGLLGRTYSVRQKAQQDRENSLKSGSFVDGPTLMNNSAAQSRTMSMPTKGRRLETANSANTGLQRRASSRKHKPLLDFTPQFEEAPQWSKRGKGHGVAAPSGVLLVEAANTREVGLNDIPKANTVFRRDTTSQRSRASANGRDRGHSGSRDPFAKGGLISGVGRMEVGGSLTNRGRLGYE
ncbi:hypothetical protein DSL72_002376 [Monilinia vaccinii-corymbosi]|uniref:PH domain-containing protein n=1 Tax=Monilinia vaccinii-corymbosi TaxID=61207 RepID=A0A8A3PCF2_9HELO|nr:hypothetical protein DSL72_002376 [Monilinia vaccinii-corymbosi]